nr:MAG TPA: hypothetical protein [Caudoviricetes sp.]
MIPILTIFSYITTNCQRDCFSTPPRQERRLDQIKS